MAKVRLHPVEQVSWTLMKNLDSSKLPDGISEDDLNSSYATHERGDVETPQLFEILYQPNSVIGVHSHDEDEILYILEGEMHFGTEILRPGSSLFIAGKSFYSFKAGPQGLKFLNFRPRADFTFHRKK